MERTLADVCVLFTGEPQIGPVIRLIREQKGFHMREIACILNVSVPLYCDFERGRVMFKKELVEKIGETLEIKNSEVFQALIDINFSKNI